MNNLGDFRNASILDSNLSFCEDWTINSLIMNLKQASTGATNAPEGIHVPQMKGQAANADPSFKFGFMGVGWIHQLVPSIKNDHWRSQRGRGGGREAPSFLKFFI